MKKKLCYKHICYRTAKCVLVWWPNMLPCETAIRNIDGYHLDFNCLREIGNKLGQLIYFELGDPRDLLGFYRECWRQIRKLYDSGELDLLYMMIDVNDPMIKIYKEKLEFREVSFSTMKWDLAGNNMVKLMLLNIATVIEDKDRLTKSQIHIMKG